MDIMLLIAILVIPLWAHFKIKTNFARYKEIEINKKLTGQEIAEKILNANDLANVYVVETKGELTDHYDSSRKTVRLSSEIFHGESIAACAIAAHECGHAIQDKEGYFYLKLRAFIFPIVNIATMLSYVIIFIGFLAQLLNVIYFGIALTMMGLIFQLITLPVEFDASRKALMELERLSIAHDEEKEGVQNMLKVAAMTYVAGVLASALQILRLVLIANDRR